MDILPVARKVAVALGVDNFNILQNNGALAHQVRCVSVPPRRQRPLGVRAHNHLSAFVRPAVLASLAPPSSSRMCTSTSSQRRRTRTASASSGLPRRRTTPSLPPWPTSCAAGCREEPSVSHLSTLYSPGARNQYKQKKKRTGTTPKERVDAGSSQLVLSGVWVVEGAPAPAIFFKNVGTGRPGQPHTVPHLSLGACSLGRCSRRRAVALASTATGLLVGLVELDRRVRELAGFQTSWGPARSMIVGSTVRNPPLATVSTTRRGEGLLVAAQRGAHVPSQSPQGGASAQSPERVERASGAAETTKGD